MPIVGGFTSLFRALAIERATLVFPTPVESIEKYGQSLYMWGLMKNKRQHFRNNFLKVFLT